MVIDFVTGTIFIVWLALLSILLFFVFRLSLKLKREKNIVEQLSLDRVALLQQIGTLSAEKDANALKDDDGFIKFLSQSRDWAYAYIETAQEQIAKFQTSVNSVIENLHKIDNDDVKTVLKAYEELATIMPTGPENLDKGEK